MNRMLCMIMFCAMMIGIARADFLDEFNSPVLDPGWRIANEDSLHWSLVDRPGFLRIQSQYLYSQPVNYFFHAEGIIDSFEVSTRLIAQPDSAGQVAFICADYDSFSTSPHAIIGLGNATGLGRVVFTVYNDTILAGALYTDTLVYLRLRTSSDTMFGEFSANNTDWTDIGSFYDSRFHQLQAVGLSALNSSLLGGTPQTPEMNGDFDWFHLVALTGVEERTAGKPEMRRRIFAAPNPFSNKVTIRYMMHDTDCRMNDMKVFDAVGRLVKSLDPLSCILNRESAVTWDGSDDTGRQVPAGVYFIRWTDDSAAAMRIVKIK